jgi:hypothetical protein
MSDHPNLDKPAIKVSHAKLERFDEGEYKSKCPACPKGVLLIHRHPQTFELLNVDNCVSCGQRFIYEDKIIGGESVRNESPN